MGADQQPRVHLFVLGPLVGGAGDSPAELAGAKTGLRREFVAYAMRRFLGRQIAGPTSEKCNAEAVCKKQLVIRFSRDGKC